MRRREFSALTGITAAKSGFILAVLLGAMTSGRAADAPKRIGILASTSCPGPNNPLTPFFVGHLAELGWVEGKNVIYDCISAYGRFEQAPALAAELVARHPDVLFGGSTPVVRALMQATSAIPIVSTACDPIQSELIRNLARPEGNVTGVSGVCFDLAAKRIALLKEVLPSLSRVAFVARKGIDPVDLERQSSELNHAADVLGFRWQGFYLAEAEDIDKLFADIAADGFDAVYIPPGPFTLANAALFGKAARQHGVPTVSDGDFYARSGALLTYGVDMKPYVNRGVEYIDKILRGTKPANLPVEQPTKFRLIINLATAKAIGLKIPEPVLARADEVIE